MERLDDFFCVDQQQPLTQINTSNLNYLILLPSPQALCRRLRSYVRIKKTSFNSSASVKRLNFVDTEYSTSVSILLSLTHSEISKIPSFIANCCAWGFVQHEKKWANEKWLCDVQSPLRTSGFGKCGYHGNHKICCSAPQNIFWMS